MTNYLTYKSTTAIEPISKKKLTSTIEDSYESSLLIPEINTQSVGSQPSILQSPCTEAILTAEKIVMPKLITIHD